MIAVIMQWWQTTYSANLIAGRWRLPSHYLHPVHITGDVLTEPPRHFADQRVVELTAAVASRRFCFCHCPNLGARRVAPTITFVQTSKHTIRGSIAVRVIGPMQVRWRWTGDALPRSGAAPSLSAMTRPAEDSALGEGPTRHASRAACSEATAG